jgi:hypothetical protein
MKHAFTLLAALLLATLAAVHAAEFHVAANSNDSNPGTITQPFATIQAGVNKLQPGDKLLVHGGVYRETITFPRSGTEQKPITLRSYKDEKAVITGCEPVTGWTLHNAAKNIWKAPMPWTLGTGRNQVFCGDEVLIEARFPNQPSRGLEMPVSGLSKLWPTFGEFANPEPGKQPGRIVSELLDGQPDNFWKGALYLGIHYGGWSVQTSVIESSKSGEIILVDREAMHWSPSHTYSADDGRGMIVRHMNALDQPGEWHWQDDVLYLIPLSGTKPDNVAAKLRQRAFDLSGREHIRVEGVSVHAGSARLEDSADCVFDRCSFEFVSHFTKAGDSTSGEIGIVVSGHDNAFLNSTIRYSAGAGIHLGGLRHTVHNCLIDETDYSGHYLFSLYLDRADDFLTGGHTLTYNTLCNVGHSWYGNSPGGSTGRWRSPSLTLANIFAHNHAFNGTLLARDWGSITGRYFSGGNLNGVPGQLIYNVLHECYDPTGMRGKSSVLGIVYLDIGTCDMDIHHNLLWAAPGSLQCAFWYNTCCVNIRDRDNVFHKEFTRTYENYPPGSSERGAGVGVEEGVNSVAVTDETAASGKHSLKVTNGSGQKPSYLPYISYSLEMEEGRLRAGFDLRIEPGAQFVYECRDAALEHKVGPRLSVDAQGWLTANNKRLLQLPHGKWVRFDLVCALGREATGTYDLTIRQSGAAPQQFDGLACPDFKRFQSAVIMSPANGPSVYYLDNVEITPEKTE